MNRRSLLLFASVTLAACSAPPAMDAGSDGAGNDSADAIVALPDASAMDSASDSALDAASDARDDAMISMDAVSDTAPDAAAEASSTSDAVADAVAVIDADAAPTVDGARDSAADVAADSAPDVLRVCTPLMTRGCYTGSASTRGVGVCRDGVETCAADGSGWGACVGQVLPSAELCATVADEDCNGSIAVCAVSQVGFVRGTQQQTATAVAVDATGNYALAGQFTGSMNLGAGPLTATATDAYVAMYSRTGALISVQQLGGVGNADVRGLAYDAAGNLYAVGSFSQQLTPLGYTAAGGNDAFVEALSSSGAVLWSTRFGDAANQEALAVAVSSQGVVVGGRFNGTITLDRTVTSAGSSDAFVAVFDPATMASRTLVSFGSSGADEITGVAANATDFVVAGNYSNAININGTAFASPLSASFVAKLAPSLTTNRWARQITASAIVARGVAMNASGVVACVGYYTGSLSAGLGPMVSAGSEDAFVVRVASNGDPLSQRSFGASGGDRAFAVSMTSAGETLVGGAFASSVEFGPSAFPGSRLTAPGAREGFLLELAPDNTVLWARQFSTSGDGSIEAVASGADGSSFAAGTYTGTVNFGTAGSSTSAGSSDAFVFKIPQ